MPIIEKLAKTELSEVQGEEASKMLGTILLPKNLKVLTDRLPKPNYKTPIKRCPSIGSLERPAAIEENKVPKLQSRRYSVERHNEGARADQENSIQQNYRRYGCNPVIQARAELNQAAHEKPPYRLPYYFILL